METQNVRRVLVESALEALNLARECGGAVAVVGFDGDERWTATVWPNGDWRCDDEHPAVESLADDMRRQVLDAYAEIGSDARIECANFESLTVEQLRDELTYLADYQG